MNVRSLIAPLLPASMLDVLRSSRRRFRWRFAQARGVVLTRDTLLANLRELGVRSGDIVLVHSSLSRLGHVDGGPDAVIDALLASVDPGGTILMPAFPMIGDTLAYAQTDPLFDPHQTPSAMGSITDRFWQRPGVLRSLHPTHSVAAYGPQAEYLVRDHEQRPNPFGQATPFHKLIEMDGRVLQLACPFWAISSFHVVEAVFTDFPGHVFLTDLFPMRYRDLDGVEHAIPVQIHDPAVFATGPHVRQDTEARIYEDCLQRGIVRTGTVGLATVHLLEARGLEEYLEELASNGRTIYS